MQEWSGRGKLLRVYIRDNDVSAENSSYRMDGANKVIGSQCCCIVNVKENLCYSLY